MDVDNGTGAVYVDFFHALAAYGVTGVTRGRMEGWIHAQGNNEKSSFYHLDPELGRFLYTDSDAVTRERSQFYVVDENVIDPEGNVTPSYNRYYLVDFEYFKRLMCYLGYNVGSDGYIKLASLNSNVRRKIEEAINRSRIELITSHEASTIRLSRAPQQVLDLQSMKTFIISWAPPSSGGHTDWSPMTATDTNVIKSILNSSKGYKDAYWDDTSSWSWAGRSGILELNDGQHVRRIAVGYHFRPHALIQGSAAPGWPLRDAPEANGVNGKAPAGGWTMGGHMCMYYHDSAGGTQSCNTAAENAYNWYR